MQCSITVLTSRRNSHTVPKFINNILKKCLKIEKNNLSVDESVE